MQGLRKVNMIIKHNRKSIARHIDYCNVMDSIKWIWQLNTLQPIYCTIQHCVKLTIICFYGQKVKSISSLMNLTHLLQTRHVLAAGE